MHRLSSPDSTIKKKSKIEADDWETHDNDSSFDTATPEKSKTVVSAQNENTPVNSILFSVLNLWLWRKFCLTAKEMYSPIRTMNVMSPNVVM